MSAFNSLELLSQAATFVQMHEDHRKNSTKCMLCGNVNRTCLCDRYQGINSQNSKCIQSHNSAFSRNIIKPNPIKYNMTNRGPYLNTPTQEVEDHFRKSLGSKYDSSKSSTEGGSSYTIQHNASVEDHFTRSLGKDWQEKLLKGKS